MMSVSVKSIKASLVNLNTTESKLEKKLMKKQMVQKMNRHEILEKKNSESSVAFDAHQLQVGNSNYRRNHESFIKRDFFEIKQ